MNTRLTTRIIFGIGILFTLWSQGAELSHPSWIVGFLGGRLLLVLSGMRWSEERGYSHLWGLLGLLGLIGAIILLLLPWKRRAPPVVPSPTWLNHSLLLAFGLFSLVLIHDMWVGPSQRWLPSVFEPLNYYGPVALVVSVAFYLRQLCDKHEAIARTLNWTTRILGLLLVVAPFVVTFLDSLNRSPGARSREFEALGIILLFILCLPSGLALTVVSFLPRRAVPPPLPPKDSSTDNP